MRKINFLAMLVGVLLITFMLFVWPNVALPQDQEKCPAVATDVLSPGELITDKWELVTAQQDTTYGFYWFFVKAKTPVDGRTHALMIVIPGAKWPVMYNYLENGILYFMRFDPKSNTYVKDESVDDSGYSAVAKMYLFYFNVTVPPRKSV